eukprot:374738-Pelagomonas_calceolata.AAC.1
MKSEMLYTPTAWTHHAGAQSKRQMPLLQQVHARSARIPGCRPLIIPLAILVTPDAGACPVRPHQNPGGLEIPGAMRPIFHHQHKPCPRTAEPHSLALCTTG